MITRTSVPEFCDLNLASSRELLEKYSNYLDIFKEFVEQVETAIEYRNTFFKNDTVGERIKFFNSLSSKLDNFDTEFVIYWFEMANTSPEYIKQKLKLDIYNITSDSIGKFTNSRYILDDSTENIMDFMMTGQRPPDYLPYNNYNKVSPWTKHMLQQASFRTNSMFRSNIAIVQTRNYRSIDSHGVNLVTDTQHFSRTETEYAEYFFDRLKQKFSEEIKIIAYYCNVYDSSGYNYQDNDNNLQKVVEFNDFQIDIEHIKTKIDVLSNKVVFIKQKVMNDDILSTEKIDVIDQPKLTTEEINEYFTKGNLLTRFNEITTRTLNINTSNFLSGILTSSDDFSKDINKNNSKSKKTNQQVSNEIENSVPEIATAQFFPSNVSYPTYQIPEWASDIYNCLGIGVVVDIFSGIADPFINNTDINFDVFSILNTFNPFNSQFLGGLGINLTSFLNFDLRFLQNFDIEQQLNNLLDTIQNFDITQLFGAFSFNLPIPSFSLGTLFDFVDNFDEIIKTISENALKTIGNAITQFLTDVACGGGGNLTPGSFANLGTQIIRV